MIPFICSVLLLFTFATASPDDALQHSDNTYTQVAPLLIEHISAENPTEEQQGFLNALYGFLAHGGNKSFIFEENLRAAQSVDFFSRVLPKYFANATHCGQIQAAVIASQITDNATIIAHRQEIITALLNTPQTSAIQAALSHAKKAETAFFNFFQPVAEENKAAVQRLKNKTSFTSTFFKYWNNKYILGGLKRLKSTDLITIPFQEVTRFNSYHNYLNQNQSAINSIKNGLYSAKDTFIYGYHNFSELPVMFWNASKSQKTLAVVLSSWMLLCEYLSYVNVKDDFDTIYEQQQALIKIATFFSNIKKVTDFIKKDAQLKKLLNPDLSKVQELFDPYSDKTSSDLKYVIAELLTSSFEGEPSYYFSDQGKILATHFWLQECKAEIIPYLEAFGIIDAYFNAASIVQDYQNHPRVQFCFPTTINNSTPIFDITGYWHPLIDDNIVVPNDINIGNNGIKNIMITGPNAGGKTTSLMSLIINIIFAQSFGIAPCSQMTFTPFAKIHSYLDITTNLEKGLSLFAAEVDRAKKLKESILSCTPGQKTFTIIDEIFSGTAPTVASDVGFKFAQQLGNMPHSITIITTHFPRLTDLEAECGTFTNYKVADASTVNGKIVYPFKLVQGISTQNIAEQMLIEQGVL